MLIQRIITASVLLVLLGLFMFAAPFKPFFPYVCCLIFSAVLHEWLTIVLPQSSPKRIPLIAAILFFGAMALMSHLSIQHYASLSAPEGFLYRGALATHVHHPWPLLASGTLTLLSAVLWLAVVPVMLFHGQVGTRRNEAFHAFMGIVSLGSTCAAVIYFFFTQGALFLLSMLAIVWIADTAAYFGGRAFKGPKLAPAISPGKTLSGGVCGILSALVWVAACGAWLPGSFADVMIAYTTWPVMILLSGLLAGYSIMGDLYESLLKRRAGVKDSGRLLPGHGGVWDRTDALISVLPIIYCFFIVWVSHAALWGRHV